MGRIRLRRDTTANWTAVNPTLAVGEPTLDVTRNLIKIGRGLSWTNTPYAKFQQPDPHKAMHCEGAEDALTLADLHAQLADALPASYGTDNKLLTETELGALGIGTQIETVAGNTLTPQSNYHYIVNGDLTLQNPTLTAGILWSCTLRAVAGALLTFPATWKVTGAQDIDQPTMVYLMSADGIAIFARLVAYPYTNPGVASRVHVAPWGNDANDGASWATSKQTVDAGATAAKAASHKTLWIATGQYFATADTGFELSGLTVYGGFEGTETSVAERSYTSQVNNIGCPTFTNPTTLSNPASSRPTAINIISCQEGAVIANLNGIVLDGGIVACNGGAIFTNCVITNCSNRRTTDYDGVIRNSFLQNCTITGNTTNGKGSVYVCSCDRCLISNNEAGGSGYSGYGGGAANSTISRSWIYRNRAHHGGGTYDCNLSQCTISYNTANEASGRGGGSYCTADTFVALDCTYEYNIMTGNSTIGGGAWGGTAYRCIYRYHTTAVQGGGAADVQAYNCQFLYNTVTSEGGAGYAARYNSNRVVINCIILGNNSGAYNGSALYHSGSGLTVSNCVIARNTGAALVSGSFYLNNCTVLHNSVANQSSNYRNCIFWRNVTEGGSGGVNHFNAGNGIALASFANPLDVVASIPAADIATFDARVLAHGYDLAAGAVAINGGNDTYNTTTLDIRDRTRKVGTIDAGAYEYQS